MVSTAERVTSVPQIPAGYLSEDQLCALLGVTKQTVRCWAARRTGPPRVVIARRPLYRERAFYEWIEAREQNFDALRRRSPRRHAAQGGA